MYWDTAIQAEGKDFKLPFVIPQCKDSTIQIRKKIVGLYFKKKFHSTVKLAKKNNNMVGVRDGSIPKFQPIPIPILEFSCQLIPILEFPNYF